jgi:hypothetical protein
MLGSLSKFLLTHGTGLIARNSRAAEFTPRTLFFRNKGIFWAADKGSATLFAAVILFSGMEVALSFIPRGSAVGTCFSYDHRTHSGLPLPILVLAKRNRNLTRALLGSHHQNASTEPLFVKRRGGVCEVSWCAPGRTS